MHSLAYSSPGSIVAATRVWQAAHEEGIEIGTEKGIEKERALEKQKLVARLQASGHSVKEIAQLLDISLAEARRLAGR